MSRGELETPRGEVGGRSVQDKGMQIAVREVAMYGEEKKTDCFNLMHDIKLQSHHKWTTEFKVDLPLNKFNFLFLQL